jgi:hypothetical protein
MKIGELIAIILSIVGIVLWMTMIDVQIEKLEKRVLIVETKMELMK